MSAEPWSFLNFMASMRGQSFSPGNHLIEVDMKMVKVRGFSKG
jgi:hypothetical protein